MTNTSFLKENPIFWSRLGGEWYPPLYDKEGNPYYGQSAEDIALKQRYHRDFAAAGVHLHSFVLDRGWPFEGKYDYTVTDQQLKQIFEADPDGYILPRIKLDAPLEWCQNHPEEVFVYMTGKGLSREEIALPHARARSSLVSPFGMRFFMYAMGVKSSAGVMILS